MRWSLATIPLAPRGGQSPPPSSSERRDLFAWSAAVGFEGVELSPRWYDLFALDRPGLLELRKEIVEAGLSISGINVDRAIVVRSASAAANRERIHAAIDIAAAVGASVVNVALSLDWESVGHRAIVTSSEFAEEEFAEARDELRGLTRLAGRCGVAVSIELHDDGLLDTAALCRRFVESMGEPNTGANPDIGNICRDPNRPGEWEDALAILAPIANCWHVKNYRGGQPAPVESGEIDYRRAMRIMNAAGYRGWVSIESRIGGYRETQSSVLLYLKELEKQIHELQRSVLESIGDA